MCPVCGTHYAPVATGPMADWMSAIEHTRARGDSMRFDATADRPFWREQPAYKQAITPAMPQSGLGPGEARWRTMNTDADVTTPLRYAMVWGLLVAAIVGTVVLALQVWSGFWVALAGESVVALIFGCVTWRILRLDDDWFKTGERDTELPPQEKPQKQQPSRVEVDVTINEPRNRGGGKVLPTVTLFSPAGYPQGLPRFAAAFLQERAAFTYKGGDKVHGLHHYHYSPQEASELQKNARKARLIEQAGKRQQWTPTDRGHAVFTRVSALNLTKSTISTPPRDA